MATRKRAIEQSAPPAVRPAINPSDFTRVKVFDETSHVDGPLLSRFAVVDLLGAGNFGIVLLGGLALTPDIDAFMSSKVHIGEAYALKIEPVFPSAGTPADLEERREKLGEVLVYYAIHELQIPRLNIAEAYFFTRMHSDNFFDGLPWDVLRKLRPHEIWLEIVQYRPTIFNITIMPNYTEGSLWKLIASPSYHADIRQFRKGYVAVWFLMTLAGLHALRQISADFVHGDLHTGNILLMKQDPYVLNFYTVGDGNAYLVPGLYTRNTTAKIADYGFASGHFVTQTGDVNFQETPSDKQMADVKKLVVWFMRTVHPELLSTVEKLYDVAKKHRSSFISSMANKQVENTLTAYITYFDAKKLADFEGKYDLEIFQALELFFDNLEQALAVIHPSVLDTQKREEIAADQIYVAYLTTRRLKETMLFWKDYIALARSADYFGSSVYLELIKSSPLFDDFKCANDDAAMRVKAASLGYTNTAVLRFMETKLELLAPVEIASIKKRFEV